MRTNIFANRLSPAVLTCAGAIGVIATAVMAARSATKATMLIDDAKQKDNDFKSRDKIRIAMVTFAPVMIVGGSTIICILCAEALNRKQRSILLSSYAVLSKSYAEYVKTNKDLHGKEAHDRIVESIIGNGHCSNVGAAEHLYDNNGHELIGNGDLVLWYDEFSERYFEASVEQVLVAEYQLDRKVVLKGHAVVNDFYVALGLPPIDRGFIDSMSNWVDFNHHKVILDDGLECYILEMIY